MPSSFACPTPNCTRQFRIESSRASRQPVACSGCGNTIRAPIICPSCDDVVPLRDPDAAVGSDVRCARGHVFTVPVWADDVLARFDALGRRLGEYRQGERTSQIAEGALRQQVSRGFCEGAVLNWLRRAMLGRKPTFGDVVKPSQDRRNALAQTENTLEKRLAAFRPAHNAFTTRQRERRETAHAWYVGKHAELDAAFQAARITESEYDAATAALSRRFHDIEDQIDAVPESPGMVTFWPTFVRAMDAQLENERRLARKTGGSARPFANMAVAHASNAAIRPGVRALVIEALQHTQAGQGVSIGVTPPSENAVGHEVGVIRLNTGDAYILFEPNFGVWAFRGAATLLEALEFVFCTAYPHQAGATHGDAHVYEVGGRVRGSYTVFASAIPSPPSTVEPSIPMPRPAVRAAPVAANPTAGTGTSRT